MDDGDASHAALGTPRTTLYMGFTMVAIRVRGATDPSGSRGVLRDVSASENRVYIAGRALGNETENNLEQITVDTGLGCSGICNLDYKFLAENHQVARRRLFVKKWNIGTGHRPWEASCGKLMDVSRWQMQSSPICSRFRRIKGPMFEG